MMDARIRETGGDEKTAALLAWYDRHARTLPWRVGPAERRAGERPDPYRVWLSEVMLQQTTAAAVAPRFERFLERFPDVFTLAQARDEDVMAAWAGLGYYGRARNLLKAARLVAAGHGGRLPETAAALARLPGIGDYTAGAIAALAFGEAVPAIDGNVERVAARVFGIATPLPAARAEIAQALRPLVPPDRPGEFAEALMDLGATICTPRNPACGLCPWRPSCRAYAEGRQAAYPVRPPKSPRPTRYGAAFVALNGEGAVLLRRRPPEGLFGGMAEVPGTAWGPAPLRAAVDLAPFRADWRPIAAVRHGLTHFALHLDVFRAEFAGRPPAPASTWWSPPDRIGGEALPTLMRKVILAACPGGDALPFG